MTIFRSFSAGELARLAAEAVQAIAAVEARREQLRGRLGPIRRRTPGCVRRSCQISSYCGRVMGMTICLAPRGGCGGASLSFTIDSPGLRSSRPSSHPLPVVRRRMTKRPPAGYPAPQYLQSGRVRKFFDKSTGYRVTWEVERWLDASHHPERSTAWRVGVPRRPHTLGQGAVPRPGPALARRGRAAEEVADLLRVSRQTVYNWVDRFQDARGSTSGHASRRPAPGRPPTGVGDHRPVDRRGHRQRPPRARAIAPTVWTAPLLVRYLKRAPWHRGLPQERRAGRSNAWASGGSGLGTSWPCRPETWRQSKGG